MNDRLETVIHNKNIRHAAEILRTFCAVTGVILQVVVLTLLLNK